MCVTASGRARGGLVPPLRLSGPTGPGARSSTDRALDYGSRGCRFESCRAREFQDHQRGAPRLSSDWFERPYGAPCIRASCTQNRTRRPKVRLSSAADLAAFVTRLRKEQGLTQAALAAKAGVRRATLADLERGRSSPSFETAVLLLRALGRVVDASTSRGDRGASTGRRSPTLDEVLNQVRS